MPDSHSRPRLHKAARERPTPRLIRLYRLTRVLVHVLYGCFYVGVLFPFFSSQRRFRSINRWSRQILQMLGLKVIVRGTRPTGKVPTLIVSNHVSWLDIWVLNSALPVRFVAKSDIRRWPVIGFLVAGAGTIFIERRKRHDTMRTNRTIVQALTSGEPVAVFPEGTTTDGTEIKPFHASLFQPALGADARVVATALRYVDRTGNLDLDASYAADRSLWASVCLILARRNLRAELIFTAIVDVRGKTRRDIARETERAIADALSLRHPGTRTETADGLPDATQTAFDPTNNLYPDRSHSARAPAPALTSARR
jgi:1-acyl-sn-glycerol-3-phosphate acyltransferase